jgi:uncharacterized protein YndB with AHSA1/START domain
MSTINLTHTLPAPPDRVWRALTDPDALAAWFWPAARYGTVARVDLRPGGRYRIEGTAAGIAVSGEYLKVEVPQRLVFTWRWDGEDEETLVTIELVDSPTGCELRLLHERFLDEASRDGNATGWSDCLDRLPGWLTGS